KVWNEQQLQSLPPVRPGRKLWVRAWSPDGRLLAGSEQAETSGGVGGISVYSFESTKYARLNDNQFDPFWFSDSRRLLTRDDTKLFVLDSESKRSHEILSVLPDTLNARQALSQDDRTIYFGLHRAEADVWMMRRN